MRIIIITQGLSRIVKPLITSEHSIVGIIEASTRFQDWPDDSFGCDCANQIYHFVTGDYISLSSFAQAQKIPYFFMNKNNIKQTGNRIHSLRPDIIVIYSMSYLLPEEIYNIPRYGCINLHPALLPEYRGPNPIFWQYYNAEKNGGVTVHYVNSREDAGDIIRQESFPITPGLRWKDFLDKAIGDIGSRLLLASINDIKNNTIKKLPQPPLSPTIRAARTTADEYKKILLNNNWSLKQLWHFLCGTELWLNDMLYMQKYPWQNFVVTDYHEYTNNNTSDFFRNNKLFFKSGVINLNCEFNLKTLLTSLMF